MRAAWLNILWRIVLQILKPPQKFPRLPTGKPSGSVLHIY